MANVLDLSVQPKKVTIANNTVKAISVQFYRNSAILALNAGDSVVIKTESSAEEAYYLSLANEGVTVTPEALA